jgi:Zn-dependent protease
MDGGKQYVGHLFTVPVYVGFEAIFLLYFAYRQYQGLDTVLIVLGITAIVLVIVLHELGHALVAQACKMPGVAITISAMGGYCSYQGSPPPGKKILITSSGPLTNFLLAGICVLLFPQICLHSWYLGDSLKSYFIHFFFFWNLILGCLNSFPLYPLDGGQVALTICTKFCRSVATAKHVTLIIAVVTATVMLGLDYFFISGGFGWNTMLIGILLFTAFTSLR